MSIPCNKTGIERAELPPAGRANVVHFFSPEPLVERNKIPPGMALRVTKAGVRSFVLAYRAGKTQRQITIGQYPHIKPVEAVRKAKALRQAIAAGKDPLAEKQASQRLPAAPVEGITVAEMLDRFMASDQFKKQKQPRHYQHAFNNLVKPAIGTTPIYSVRRSTLANMLDDIARDNGPVMADRTVGYLGAAFTWWEDRDDDFTRPRMKGLRRAHGRARERILNDDEIRAFWRVTCEQGVFGAVLQVALLTGGRIGEVAGMRWSEIGRDRVWTLPPERHKTGKKTGSRIVPLSGKALEIIKAQPKGDGLVFLGRDGAAITATSRKQRLDKALADAGTPIEGWVVHDLRRTARSLMSAAGIPSEVAERVVGHKVGKAVEQIYDRHDYLPQMRAAVEKLAGQIDRIIEGADDNVVPLMQTTG